MTSIDYMGTSARYLHARVLTKCHDIPAQQSPAPYPRTGPISRNFTKSRCLCLANENVMADREITARECDQCMASLTGPEFGVSGSLRDRMAVPLPRLRGVDRVGGSLEDV